MAMPEPKGAISLTMDALRSALSRCDAWQELVDADDAAEALASIYLAWKPAPAVYGEYTLTELQALRPCAIIYPPEQQTHWHWRRGAEDGHVNDNGTMIVDIEVDSPEGLDQGGENLTSAEQFVTLSNFLGQLIVNSESGKQGLMQDSLLHVRGVSAIGPLRSDTADFEKIGDMWMMSLLVQFGNG